MTAISLQPAVQSRSSTSELLQENFIIVIIIIIIVMFIVMLIRKGWTHLTSRKIRI